MRRSGSSFFSWSRWWRDWLLGLWFNIYFLDWFWSWLCLGNLLLNICGNSRIMSSLSNILLGFCDLSLNISLCFLNFFFRLLFGSFLIRSLGCSILDFLLLFSVCRIIRFLLSLFFCLSLGLSSFVFCLSLFPELFFFFGSLDSNTLSTQVVIILLLEFGQRSLSSLLLFLRLFKVVFS